MVLIKAKRLPPRLPRPQGSPNTPKKSPLQPRFGGALYFPGQRGARVRAPFYRAEETGGSTRCLG
jgi:hypothetical protein